MSSITEVLSESLEQPLDAAAGARRADAGRVSEFVGVEASARSAWRAAPGRQDRGGPVRGEGPWCRHPLPGRCRPVRPSHRTATSISARLRRLRRSCLASLTATAMSHGRSLAGSRTLPIFFQAMSHAACVASSAMARSPATYGQTRRMSSWCAAMMRRKANSSPAAADAIRSPASCGPSASLPPYLKDA